MRGRQQRSLRTMLLEAWALLWRDVVECEVGKETDEWKAVFIASLSIVAPYYKYEAFIDSKTGR